MARVGIDLDGVCYDFAASLREWLGRWGHSGGSRREGCSVCARYTDPQRWEFYKDWGMTTEAFCQHVREGVEAGVVFLWGPAHPGTREALEALRDAGHQNVCVTDRLGLGGEQARANTWDWIAREKLVFHELNFDANKTAYDCDYFVDDRLENYDALDAAGVKVYLWDRPWNQDDSKERRRVSSWDEFLSAIDSTELDDAKKRWINDRVTESIDRLEESDEVRITSSTGGQKGRKPARWGLIPKRAMGQVAEVFGLGAEKYDDWNWRKGYDWDLSIDSLYRHMGAWEEGERFHEVVPGKRAHHLASVIFHALVLLTFEEEHPEFDTRYKREIDPDTLKALFQ